MKLFSQAVILSHRYLGIVLSLLVIMWFATGITMMYAGGMPRVTPELRLDRLDPVDFSRVTLTAAQAAERVGLDPEGRATLLTVIERPAYRFGGGRASTTVFADTGEIVEDLSLSQSRAVAARFARVRPGEVHFVRTLHDVDQWTLQTRLPLHKFTVDDEARTELYVSPQSGEVAMMTTRKSRGLAWISTIPHWMYFTGLRTNQPLWYQLVVWTSALACVLAVLGLILGVTHRRARYVGPMRWHYVSGIVFGVFTFTFAFSGLLSMEPWEWSNAPALELPRNALTGGPVDLTRFPAADASAWNGLLAGKPAKEIEFARMLDDHYFIVRRGANERDKADRERLHQPYPIRHARIEDDRIIVSADSMTVRQDLLDEHALLTRLSASTMARVVESELMASYDDYYYSRVGQTPLPALRVKFDDPAETWVYVDPSLGQVVTAITRWGRVERWLYHGLHSLDFNFLYNSRPSWDIVMIVLCLGGLTTSSLGLVMGIRRMRRAVGRVPDLTPVGVAEPLPRQ